MLPNMSSKVSLKKMALGFFVAASLMSPSLVQNAAAQDPGQAPPPRIIGAVEVDKLTQAPLQVVRSVSLDATTAEVFAFVTDHSQWPALLSAIESVDVAGSGRVGVADALMDHFDRLGQVEPADESTPRTVKEFVA